MRPSKAIHSLQGPDSSCSFEDSGYEVQEIQDDAASKLPATCIDHVILSVMQEGRETPQNKLVMPYVTSSNHCCQTLG